ncbi:MULTISPECIES: YkvA family protein [Bacillaceae]|uniref:YkvA family protein n=1 Tax=Bacillales TaxID=1385 RepID=UPI0024B34D5A|nr:MULTISPECIES: YkvA family protein [Bacillaceae]MDO6656716.1 YkvA family protein [Anaerobacillus sp. 1_MG-2023]
MNRMIKSVFKRMTKKAVTVMKDKDKMKDVSIESLKKGALYNGRKGMDEMWVDVKTFSRLVQEFRKGSYRDISKKSVVMIVGALLYFVSPIDAVPDLLAGIGLLDDVAVIGFVASQLKQELEKFREWETGVKI